MQRARVLDALTTLVMTHVVPNMGYSQTGKDGEAYFDLDRTIGRDVSGFVLGVLFEPQFPDLKKPADTVLKQALDAIEIDLADAASRDAFFHCWEAQTAARSAQRLLKFLSMTTPESVDAVSLEVDGLEKLLEHALPGDLKYRILDTIFDLSRQRAFALEMQTTGPFVATTIDRWHKLFGDDDQGR